MYSQNDEEAFLEKFFTGKTGRFLDIGAYNGIEMSNTRRLLELGWQGVLVEAHWGNFTSLCGNSQVFGDRVTLVCAALAPKAGLRKLWVDTTPERFWSTTLSEDLVRSGSVMSPSRQLTLVSCITMDSLWPLGPYDFISMDAEWEDFEILVSQGDAWKQVPILCVETRSPTERISVIAFLQSKGFAVIYETKENMICQRT